MLRRDVSGAQKLPQVQRSIRMQHMYKYRYVQYGAYLAAVNIIALRLPNVEAATNSGIHQAITPSILSANVCTETNMENTVASE